MVVAWSCSVLLALFAQALDLAQSDLSTAQGKVRLGLEVLRAVDDQPLASGQQVYAKELLYVDLTISIQKEFLEQQLLPLWRMPLDLQVELSTPWAEESISWRALPNELNHGTSFVMDHEKSFLTRLPEQSDGWARFQLRQELVTTSLGAWTLPAARLRFAWATRFEDDLVRGSIALDQQEAVIRTKEWAAHTVDLPTAGRPKDFLGMVGRYTMEMDSKVVSTASAPEAELALPDEETWQVRIAFRGTGYLQLPFAWQPNFGPDFALRGSFFENDSEGFTWVGEVQSSHRGAELPSVAWSYFDPSNGGHYETLHTQGIGASASPAAPGSSLSYLPWALGGGLLVAVSAMLFLSRRRRVSLLAQLSVEQRVRRTAKIVRSATAQSSAAQSTSGHLAAQPSAAQPSAAQSTSAQSTSARPAAQPPAAPRDLIDHLAELLSCRRDAIYTRDLLDRLHAAGLPIEFAQDLNSTVQVILQARFAEQGTVPSQQYLSELTERLQSYRRLPDSAR